MSIKSLLQVILLLLIFLIIGGLYFVYFYPGNLDRQIIINQSLKKDNQELSDQNISVDKEIQEVSSTTEMEKKKEIQFENNNELPIDENLNKKISEDISDKSRKEKVSDQDNISNVTKEIEYVTTNSKGEIFKIFADYGITNIKNSNILDLEKVDGIISSPDRSKIFITSDYANYNYTTQNSKFYRNVVIKYDQKVITCDNLDLNMTDNLAIAYNNVIVKDDVSLMKAQIVTMDIISKDIKINSDEKVKILTN